MPQSKIRSTLAKEDDGTIQINLTIPREIVAEKEDGAILKLIKNLEIPGFRKGTAPKNIASKHIESGDLTKVLLQDLIPEAYSQALKEHRLKPFIAPKFEVVSAEKGSDWQIRAITCGKPDIDLGDYRSIVAAAVGESKIWTPGKGPKSQEPKSQEEKERIVLEAILKSTQVKIPRILIEEEVNRRIARLLEQIEKLGITLDQYLSSTGKTVESLRKEYDTQARDSIKLELALNEIARQEKLTVGENEIDKAIEGASSDSQLSQKLNSPLQRSIIRSILLRRHALEKLTLTNTKDLG